MGAARIWIYGHLKKLFWNVIIDIFLLFYKLPLYLIFSGHGKDKVEICEINIPSSKERETAYIVHILLSWWLFEVG